MIWMQPDHFSGCLLLKGIARRTTGGILLLFLSAILAGAQTARIVGIGAATCEEFLRHVEGNPNVQRDYFAWAQGFMSGIILRAPPGRDEQLNLNPSTFPLSKQVEFIRASCGSNSPQNYSDAVISLYIRLREEGPT
jgi:hypothetical protein